MTALGRRSSEAEQGSHKPRVSGSSPLAGTMVMLEDRFVASFQRHFPDLAGQRLVVAISGGPDSTSLAWLLARTGGRLGVSIALGHVHHGVRGAEADEDARFCQRLADKLGVPFFLAALPPPPKGVSPEAFWRKERYAALERQRQQWGAAAVATGHTLEDQAETVLLKLLRGSGPRGVAGIRRRAGTVIRPLLAFCRQELAAYLASLGEGFRQDQSNLVPDRPRTFLRWRVLPLLVEGFPRALEHLAAFGEELAEDEALLGELASQALPPLRLGERCPVGKLAALPAPLRRRWLQALAATLPLAEPPSREQFALFARLLDRGSPRALDLGSRWVLRREREVLLLAPPPLAPFAPQPVPVPGVLPLPGGFVLGVGERVGRADHRAWLAPELAGKPLVVRSLPAGLRFRGKEVRKELARAGVPREWRAAWPVLCLGDTIVWVPGVGVAPSWGREQGLLAELEEPWERHGRSSPRKPSPSG